MKTVRERCIEFLDLYDDRPPCSDSAQMLEAFIHAEVAREMARGKLSDTNALVLFLESAEECRQLRDALLAAQPGLRLQKTEITP